jgi:23S rRNA pseudouridine955/2504/2580 synthase
MNPTRKDSMQQNVQMYTISNEECGQRLDNFLIKILKGVPKSHIYRIVRGGEVRVNKGRVKIDYRLETDDVIRIPPIRTAQKDLSKEALIPAGQFPIIFEDDDLLIINKPCGTAVHGGSGVSFGVIEQLRKNRPEARYLELVHRLDRETSGLLMIAKKRSALVKLHAMIRADVPEKSYTALGLGVWPAHNGQPVSHVKAPLLRFHLPNGERMVQVNENDGIYAHSIFTVEQQYQDCTLVDVLLKTGRTHQIRVHMQHLGCPIAGDPKYGDFAANRALSSKGLKRMFLHARRLKLPHPSSGEMMTFIAPLPPELSHYLQILGQARPALQKS